MSVFSSEETCHTCNSTTEPEVDVAKAVFLAIVLVVFVIFGVLGNILVILSVVCHRHWRSVTHYFIANLAAADLLLSSAVVPFTATSEALGRWVFGRFFCSVWAALDVLCCTASILSLCVISIDRYLAVSYPLRYPAMATGRRGLAAVAALWGLSAAISVGPLFGWKQPDPEEETVCQITEEPVYALFSALGSFYIPLAIILFMYCRVYSVAKRGKETLKKCGDGAGVETEGVVLRVHRGNAAQRNKHEEDNGTGRHKHIAGNLPKMLKLPREEKAAKTLGVVVGCFVLCWLPFFLVLPIGSMFPSWKPPETVFKITFWLGYFNSCINPIIYPCFSQEFKRAFHNVLHGRCRRNSQTQGPHSPGLVSSTLHLSRPNVVSSWRCCGRLRGSSEGASDESSSAIRSKKSLLMSWCFSTHQSPVPENSAAKVLQLSLHVKGEPV
ncbi:alpha-1A adrenergic receptor-like isoform X1 [Syngnathus acus]|uniref:alpha-1A adrenergic receptor-like isoform X1 n=1 Tax=Syngnathus acus TaxID=161584 RepID=UPI0018860FD3|nr:alpha-1A adrenergic receptor-like isoform X1 [Syngnathus acus]XP_037121917.1 alpha-1A adrenergic receptor-like isoform X1 [Syngnathus acus]XP_037121918.1 alpha-1A adrenergic receptor-like isoform X1 [Syngnathus acus]